MSNNILLAILGTCFIIGIVVLVVAIYQICKCAKDIKISKKKIERLVVEVFKAFDVGDFCTLKSGQEIVLTDKFEENGKYYFEYKYFNEDARTIEDVINDEKIVVTVKEFSKIVKHFN
jgi:hypothetical protein